MSLHITRGVPASGKSTWARSWVAEDPERRVRVNRDDLRLMLHGRACGLTFAQEQDITRIQHDVVRDALARGLDVVVDDTNLRAKFLRELLAVAGDSEVVIKDFPVTLDEAIRRDAARDATVGEDVIRGFFARYIHKGRFPAVPEPKAAAVSPFSRYMPNDRLPEAYIFDIDGTLAQVVPGGRNPYDMTRVDEDVPDDCVVRLARGLHELNYDIVLVSGRNQCREATEKWLRDNHIPFNALFMRDDDDQRGDDVVKHEILHRDIAPVWNVRGVFDDRRKVIEMWRAVGIKTFQCQDGDF